MKRRVLEECLTDARGRLERHPDRRGYQHFSYVVQGAEILGVGFNRISSPLRGYPQHGKLHSEPDAWAQCRGIIDRSSSWSVVNLRLSKKGELKISRPCECCYNFLKRLGCRDVWFSTPVGFARLQFLQK